MISWLRSDQRCPTTRSPPGSSGVRVAPVAQQVVEDGIQTLFGRIPRFEQVVVETDVVDRPDRDVGVGVRRDQHELGVGRVPARLFEELDAGHSRHPLIGGDQPDLPVPQRELAEHRERFRSRGRPDDLVLGAVLTTEVARDRLRDGGIVVDRQNRRLGHRMRLSLAPVRERLYVDERPRTDVRTTVSHTCCTHAPPL